jgi:HAE1 family hydrophobic/amphiphilic exporter-1
MKRIKAISADFPGLIVRTEPIGIFGSANQSPVQIEVRGSNMQELSVYADSVIAIAKGVQGLKNLKSSYEEGQPEVKIVFDRERLSAYGMTVGEAAMAIRTALAGNTDAKYKEGETEYDINLIFDKINRSNANDVGEVNLMNRMGQMFKVSDVATIFYGKGPAQITRKNRERVVQVTAGLEGRPLGGVIQELTEKFAALHRPKSVTEPYFAGDAENQRKSGADIIIAFILGILFVYMIMVALFESYAHPLTIMFSLPVALIGTLTLLWITGNTLSLFTQIGIIMLMGLVTKNAILIVDRANDRRSTGMGVKEALLEAGPTRLRPIIMTTVTMILGMMPLAIGFGEGAEFRQGMATAIIGGLTSSMILTLVLVPVMYTFVEGWRVKFPRFFKRINIFAKFRKPRPIYSEAA